MMLTIHVIVMPFPIYPYAPAFSVNSCLLPLHPAPSLLQSISALTPLLQVHGSKCTSSCIDSYHYTNLGIIVVLVLLITTQYK